MWVPFESLAEESRVWVYQASRSLTLEEQHETALVLESFCNQWAAHGNSLKSSFKIDHGQFLVLAVDEGWSGASGCSIDGSVKFLKALQERLKLNFFDRTKSPFLENNVVKLIAQQDIKDALSSGVLTPASLTFNTLVASKKEFESCWIVPLERTWLVRFLPKITTA